MSEHRKAFALGPQEGEALWGVGALTTIKVSGPETGNAYAMIEDFAPLGTGAPPHFHALDDEAFYVLEGEVRFSVATEPPFHARAGAFVFVPGGVIHAFEVISETARYLIITTPRHMQFYRAIADPAGKRALPPDAPLDMDRIGAACEAFGVTGV